MKIDELRKALAEARAKVKELESLLNASERAEQLASLALVEPDYLGKVLGVAEGVRRFADGGGIAVGFVPRPEFIRYAVDRGINAFRIQGTAVFVANSPASFDWALARVDW